MSQQENTCRIKKIFIQNGFLLEPNSEESNTKFGVLLGYIRKSIHIIFHISCIIRFLFAFSCSTEYCFMQIMDVLYVVGFDVTLGHAVEIYASILNLITALIWRYC